MCAGECRLCATRRRPRSHAHNETRGGVPFQGLPLLGLAGNRRRPAITARVVSVHKNRRSYASCGTYTTYLCTLVYTYDILVHERYKTFSDALNYF